MSRTITWMIITLFVAQFMVVGIGNITTLENNDEESTPSENVDLDYISTESSDTSGRDAPHIDCEDYNGLGGPVWENDDPYDTSDIVEYPPNTGNYYILSELNITNMNTTMSPVDNNSADLWSGPCTCAQIAVGGVPTWELNTIYNPWQIVAWNSTYWVAQDAGAPVDEEPGNESTSGTSVDFWGPCSERTPCTEFDGHGGSVWDSTTSYSINDTVEWPANSGLFWMSITSGPTGEPASNGKWIGPCSCLDIWAASSSLVWDSNTSYGAGMMVEFPAGSQDIWMAIAPSTTMGVDPTYAWADGNEWELCSSGEPDGSPCAGLTVVGVWDSAIGTNIATGEIYEYPANSDNLYQVNSGGPFTSVSAPDVDLDVWSPIACPCEETWNATGQPVWDSSSTYQIHSVVEWPAGSMDLWMAYAIQGVGEEPGVDAEWRLCHEGSPCAGLTVVGVWDTTMNVTSGEIYEYPANSHNLYQVNPGSPFWSVSAPDVDMDVWSPIDCPCNETWDANGQPVWDATVDYPGFYVVEWPAGSSTLYIPLESSGVSSGTEPGVDTHWVLCESTSPCAGLTVVGVWDATIGTNIATGEIYEYPANSDNLYQVNSGGPFTSVSAPDVDLDVWTPIDCPCKETWVANGQPVWDSANTGYPGNYVVEWGAGTGILYISEGGGLTSSAGEPGVDTHWTPCVEQTPIVDEEKGSWIPSIGIFGTLIASSLGLIVATRRREII
ncbi:MAG: hypothetical protein QF479_03435 [Candidatus Poseidoniaceae archaeon]|nr:hypothetical protein [Candidatus Poseidoniaceae archaeon]